MIPRLTAVLVLSLAAMAAHADPLPVPAAKAAYIGHWTAKTMDLLIAPNGQITYKRDEPGKKVNMNIELTGFEGDNFRAGVNGMLKIDSTFVVTRSPHKDGGKMKMTVDGVELTKAD